MARTTEQEEFIDEEPQDIESSSDAELLPNDRSQGHRWAKNPSLMHSVAIGAVCLFGFVSLTSLVAFSEHHPRGRTAPQPLEPLTVRALLESHELADVATQNILAIGGTTVADRALLKGKVMEAFMNISSMIQRQDPEAHRKLETLTLTPAQKDSALRVLKKYSDARMVSLTREVRAAVDESEREGGDHNTLKAKLTQRLMPKLSDLRALTEEMFPGKDPNSIDMDMDKDQWHSNLKVDFGRRLSAVVGDSLGGVTPQARTLFKSLESELGEAMPKAPARMLFSLTSDATTPSSTSSADDPGFMDCLMKAVPNPMEVCSCIASNMGSVVSMMTGFMKSGR
eukprot:CAMPEP_0203959860 /NCGR_PEP_ID=MMETSP0359-20131031/90767_1 /ASSEMBLY_ACC=CAM_ASM_000338 /TAXON_ID=268821 /ORGANISM="Scrippsiella Hangoei, Strain SHTV-5" /LENGTH=339 /DNA_ID=CAMNT_0050894047 /DNA_START=71 /DNA_END=1090 /DNA_ORIENTATION=+